MNLWLDIINWGGGAICGGGAGTAVAHWLGKAALEKYRAKLAQELEGWKAGYQKALDENRIRFSRLHLDRARAIKKLYARLASAEDALTHFVAQPEDGRLREDAQSRRVEAANFYQRNRIFFTEAECKLIEQCTDWNLEAFIQAQASNDSSGYSAIARNSAALQAIGVVTQSIPELLRMLNREFSKALGMAEGHGAEEAP